MVKKCLTIAGSDCSGGAGIQADLKTFSALGCYGMSVITSVVAENTQRVISIQDVDINIIEDQIDACFEDIEIDGLKIGMLSNIDIMLAIKDKLLQYKPKNVVIDPVMYAKGGVALMKEDCIDTLIKEIIPLAFVLTPNIPEAEKITNKRISTLRDMEEAGKVIYDMGCKNVLIKGGHLENDATDILYNGEEIFHFKNEKINTKNTHGTGCTLSSAIASELTKENPVDIAVGNAKKYIVGAITNDLCIGKGNGSINHFWEVW
ncbi:MAG: bifunctional hydroxymethylpyrimidine kinase/phosphomethylpyrimidine kinase [Rickettsiales bacterium]|nr:bifunctional hydroxymethylpyrimidine kinase/phosphomethylpyrimidine kinase [Rickettsiales bacterium]